jgi:hypothetical protein
MLQAKQRADNYCIYYEPNRERKNDVIYCRSGREQKNGWRLFQVKKRIGNRRNLLKAKQRTEN